MLHDSVMASLLDPGLASDAVAFVELTARWITALLKVGWEEGRVACCLSCSRLHRQDA